MRYKILFYCAFIFMASCNNTSNKKQLTDSLTQQNDTTKAKIEMQYKIDTSKQVNTILPKADSIITADIKNGKSSVHGYLSGIGNHVTIIVPVENGDSIKAEIIPESDTANIRFNQIYIPVGKSGKYDGPFSKNLNYPITSKGNYKLIIGENLMAENNWQGNFTCNITIR